MKVLSALFLVLSFYTQTSHAQERIETEELHCARTISSISAILTQLKNNPAIRKEQITAVIDGHTSDPALRAFIRAEIVPRIFSLDARSTEAYLSSSVVQERCLHALSTYVDLQGK